MAFVQAGGDMRTGGTESLSKDIVVQGFSIAVAGKTLFESADLRIAHGHVSPSSPLSAHPSFRLSSLCPHLRACLFQHPGSAVHTHCRRRHVAACRCTTCASHAAASRRGGPDARAGGCLIYLGSCIYLALLIESSRNSADVGELTCGAWRPCVGQALDKAR